MKNALSSPIEVWVVHICDSWTTFYCNHLDYFILSLYCKDEGTSDEARKAQEISDLLKEKEKLLEVNFTCCVICQVRVFVTHVSAKEGNSSSELCGRLSPDDFDLKRWLSSGYIEMVVTKSRADFPDFHSFTDNFFYSIISFFFFFSALIIFHRFVCLFVCF